MKPSVWLIAGPTASGKSALALRLATALGGEVVNADSMQLYAGLEVLSAAPSASERTKAPHHLYGVADAGDSWSVGRWLHVAERTLVEVAARGRTAILVGGTGLYFRALTSGLADIPAVPEAARAEAQTLFSRQGEAAFREALSRHDPSAARDILPGDRQRLLRAWSVAAFTGRSLSDWQASTRPILGPDAFNPVVLDPPRAELYARCDARLAAMVAGGALEEVMALERRRLSPDLPATKALGVRELAAHLRGETSLDGAVASAQLATRHYAKRQLTWFRNQTPDWPRIRPADPQGQWGALRALASLA